MSARRPFLSPERQKGQMRGNKGSHMMTSVCLMVQLNGFALCATVVSRTALAFPAITEVMPGSETRSGSSSMCGDSLSTVDLEAFQKNLVDAISHARSLDEITAYLRSQRCVKSVELANYLLKSNPPQRDFVVEFMREDGATFKKIVNIFDLGNQRFQFHKMRDP
jgi:hypothetical protein